MSPEYLDKHKVRIFARRARGYLCAYHRLAEENEEAGSNECEHISPQQIEKLVKDCKTHRCAMDFDNKYIKSET